MYSLLFLELPATFFGFNLFKELPIKNLNRQYLFEYSAFTAFLLLNLLMNYPLSHLRAAKV